MCNLQLLGNMAGSQRIVSCQHYHLEREKEGEREGGREGGRVETLTKCQVCTDYITSIV